MERVQCSGMVEVLVELFCELAKSSCANLMGWFNGAFGSVIGCKWSSSSSCNVFGVVLVFCFAVSDFG